MRVVVHQGFHCIINTVNSTRVCVFTGGGFTARCAWGMSTHKLVKVTARQGGGSPCGRIISFPAHLARNPGGQRREQHTARHRPDATDSVCLH